MYPLREVPILGAFRFSSSSSKPLCRPAGLQYALNRAMRLQSLCEAVAVRAAFNNSHKNNDFEMWKNDTTRLDYSNLRQVLSTIVLHHIDRNNKIVTSFAEVPTTHKGLALMNEGYDANIHSRELIKSVNDYLVAKLLKSAQDNNRIVPALVTYTLELSTTPRHGRSPYGANEYARAAFGHEELAEMNAAYLHDNDFDTGEFFDYGVERLETFLKGDKKNVHIRPVNLGGCDYNAEGRGHDHFDGIDSAFNFYDSGRARGVALNTAQKKEP